MRHRRPTCSHGAVLAVVMVTGIVLVLTLHVWHEVAPFRRWPLPPTTTSVSSKHFSSLPSVKLWDLNRQPTWEAPARCRARPAAGRSGSTWCGSAAGWPSWRTWCSPLRGTWRGCGPAQWREWEEAGSLSLCTLRGKRGGGTGRVMMMMSVKSAHQNVSVKHQSSKLNLTFENFSNKQCLHIYIH